MKIYSRYFSVSSPCASIFSEEPYMSNHKPIVKKDCCGVIKKAARMLKATGIMEENSILRRLISVISRKNSHKIKVAEIVMNKVMKKIVLIFKSCSLLQTG
jgi:hypothetical protein